MKLSIERTRTLFFVALLCFIAASCARQPEPSAWIPADDLGFRGQIAGFFVGLFHGFTMALNLCASLFFNVRIYTFPNSGRLYDLGYVIGAAAFFGGSAKRTGASRD